MRVALLSLLTCVLASFSATAGDIDPAVAAAFANWGLSAPNAGSLVFCHGYNCNFRTQIGISAADRGSSPR